MNEAGESRSFGYCGRVHRNLGQVTTVTSYLGLAIREEVVENHDKIMTISSVYFKTIDENHD